MKGYDKMTNRCFIKNFKEIIPISGTSIRRLSKKIDTFKLYDIFSNIDISDRVKKQYLYHLKIDEMTKDNIWETYQGDMWVTSEIYDKPMSGY